MNSVDDYARNLANREGEELDTLSELVKAASSLMQIRIQKLS